MNVNKLIQRIAYLEFANDQLTTELKYMDRLLKSIGFPEGLRTVKEAAEELHHGKGSSPQEGSSDPERFDN